MKLNIALGEKQTETRNAITKNIFKVVIIWIINITYMSYAYAILYYLV